MYVLLVCWLFKKGLSPVPEELGSVWMACVWLTHTGLLLGQSPSRGSGGAFAERQIIRSHLVFA